MIQETYVFYSQVIHLVEGTELYARQENRTILFTDSKQTFMVVLNGCSLWNSGKDRSKFSLNI